MSQAKIVYMAFPRGRRVLILNTCFGSRTHTGRSIHGCLKCKVACNLYDGLGNVECAKPIISILW